MCALAYQSNNDTCNICEPGNSEAHTHTTGMIINGANHDSSRIRKNGAGIAHNIVSEMTTTEVAITNAT